VQFEYALLNYYKESETRYRTQLVEVDRQPSNWTADAKKEYTTLPEGSYTFKVWGKDYTGNISGPLIIKFNIRAAPWRTWWAYLCYLMTIIIAGYYAYSWRIQMVKRRQTERINFLSQLLESTRVINSQLDLDTVLQNIAEQSAKLIDAEPGGIGLIEGNKVVFRSMWVKDRWKDTKVAYQLNEGIAGRVAATATAMIVNSPNPTQFLEDQSMSKRYSEGSFLDLPITNRTGQVVGVLDVRGKPGRALFNENDQRLLESLANQAAIAIENAALYGELEEKNLMIIESMRELERVYKKEQEITHALQELNQMKTTFMVVTSHEMRTPLTILSGYQDILLNEHQQALSSIQAKSLSACQRAVKRLISLVDTIQEMLNIEGGRVAINASEFDVSQVINAVRDDLADAFEERKQTIIVTADDKIPPITADLKKFQSIIFHLLQNAIKFTPDNGDIRIQIKREGDDFHIVVQDSGTGIDAAEIERIFDKFYTGMDSSHHRSGKYQFNTRGTGLGLAIAKSYTEAHGGRIWAESGGKGGHGTSFHLLIPIACHLKSATDDGRRTTDERMEEERRTTDVGDRT
jgi:signal transduction histidine kinase